jgi:DNA-binding transcriptional LysR family regulator
MSEFHAGLGQMDFLLVIDALFKQRNVTRAAQELGISQSALSHSLNKLRARFHDPLFVRAGAEMVPTPLAEKFADPIARSLAIIRNDVLNAVGFDPATTTRTFTVCVSEVGAIAMVPRILARLRQVAPQARLAPRSVPPELISEALESGSADLAVGYYPMLKASTYQQALCERTYVGIVRNDHPEVGATLTLDQLYRIPMIRTTSVHAINTLLDAHMAEKGIKPTIALETSYVMALAFLTADSDWLALIPEELVATMQALAPVRPVAIPLALPPISIKHYWHQRYKDDEANRFLRQTVYEALAE